MEVTNEMVNKLAHLSKLRFSETEKEEIAGDLEKMIGFVEKLNELDLKDEAPLMHMSDEVNVLREDVLQGSVTREAALKNATTGHEEFFQVPKVIKKQ